MSFGSSGANHTVAIGNVSFQDADEVEGRDKFWDFSNSYQDESWNEMWKGEWGLKVNCYSSLAHSFRVALASPWLQIFYYPVLRGCCRNLLMTTEC